MKSGNRELVDRLAAEYVLGTLRGRARRRFERWLVSPQVGAIVKDWEDRLGGLEPPLRPVAPPATVWPGIERKLRLRRSTPMRWLAIAASLALFALVAVFMLRDPGDVTPPPQLAATARGILQSDPQTIYWRVEVLGDNQELSLRVQQVHELPAGKAHELWALRDDGTPVSLGLLPRSGEQKRVLTAAQREALARSQQIAVSLEPEGGSTTGLPTGPVLLVAPLARA
jgi:anti-sigma-K factor RskA